MFTKKRLFGLMLMLALTLAPVCVNAMGGADDNGGGSSANNNPGSGQQGGQPANPDVSLIDGKILYYVNMPLQTALNKIQAWGAKGKFVITLLTAYLGYSASGTVAEHVQSIPAAVKGLVGADCEDDGCRSDKDWTTAA